MSELTADQLREYEQNGCLLVSGLIPDATAAAAEEATWRLLGLRPDEPRGWSAGTSHGSCDSPEILACYTPDYLAAAAQLAGEPEGALRAPGHGYGLNVFPSDGPWTWPAPHIDHAIKEHGHKTFPRAFRLAAMTYLHDVAPHGGGTVVWPGGHLRVRALAESDPQRYELMYVLNQELRRAGLGEPVEVTPRRGDVLFYHYLCPHAGSNNVSDRPRFALNTKW